MIHVGLSGDFSTQNVGGNFDDWDSLVLLGMTWNGSAIVL